MNSIFNYFVKKGSLFFSHFSVSGFICPPKDGGFPFWMIRDGGFSLAVDWVPARTDSLAHVLKYVDNTYIHARAHMYRYIHIYAHTHIHTHTNRERERKSQ